MELIMNIIKTVGDLQKALSAYDPNTPFEFSVDNQTLVNAINNDTAIFQLTDHETNTQILHIALTSVGA